MKNNGALSRNYQLSEQWLKKCNPRNDEIGNEQFEETFKADTDLFTENKINIDGSQIKNTNSTRKDLANVEFSEEKTTEHDHNLSNQYSEHVRNCNSTSIKDQSSEFSNGKVCQINTDAHILKTNLSDLKQTETRMYDKESHLKTDNVKEHKLIKTPVKDSVSKSLTEEIQRTGNAPFKRKAEERSSEKNSGEEPVTNSQKGNETISEGQAKKRKTDSSVRKKGESEIPRGKR